MDKDKVPSEKNITKEVEAEIKVECIQGKRDLINKNKAQAF